MSVRVIGPPVLKELEELLRSPLLKEAHKRALDSLHLSRRDLGDLAITVYEATRDLLELKVPRHIGVDEDTCQLSGSDDELGDEVDSVVAVATKVSGNRLIGAELAVELDNIHACWQGQIGVSVSH